MKSMQALAFGSLLGLAVLGFSCKDDDDTATPVNNVDTFGATLNGAQEVPAVSTTATGNYTGRFDKNSKVLSYTVTYQGLTPTMGHIHSVTAATAEGNNGPVSIPFGNVLTSPITGQTTLTQTQQDEMYANRTYANLHTTRAPGGEIRGNIRKTN
ncbi:CHRD domain-containing protein [Rudanella paleaurantiibacter]|uniref:CHRD domain-containing protein n=1 Tax=Rudanella paleaurantiibacter TaxID=2614655 RepID=A0A7J5U4Z9_9BACT|nr:CHRD domain-containing protein [Rudanella paleaurantiibacter]KAB7732846.1 CHRD domain-containing protein [Rudanella paleaurantiibacter]